MKKALLKKTELKRVELKKAKLVFAKDSEIQPEKPFNGSESEQNIAPRNDFLVAL
jgi:hypothetical protein